MQNELLDFRQDMQLEIGLTRARLQAVQTPVTLRREKMARTPVGIQESASIDTAFGAL